MTPSGGLRLEKRLSALPPTFTATQARQAGLSPRDLTMLATAGDVEELSRGVYRRADAPATAYLDLLAVCMRVPRAVVCGESALAIHELIDDIPMSVHIAVPRGTHRPSISYPPTTVAQYAAETFSLAVERFEAAPHEMVPMYSAARSVVDAMRHRRRFGETLALAALGRYLRREGAGGVRDLQEIARELGALSAVRPAVEAVLA
ncbi:type IV toxin-antitoxin system AbiEi family antitoxin domain-containing protein [Streptosporangium sp. NPDC023963]|uniref:type IV toxin-antitoxin system AbiEi family antitoxin domain-containing protein n=1 Tax=Streptosporangium sp. NPDC023963 TaxID=3155608 RepID=UPI0034313467